MKLKRNEMCPLHHMRDCCGRASAAVIHMGRRVREVQRRQHHARHEQDAFRKTREREAMTHETIALKTTEPLPSRMQGLPVDERGYVVPWFVDWQDGKPEFRAMDPEKFLKAIREKRCWVCGQPLGVYVCFVAGPMCGINRTSSEPPSHSECAHWSARNCPFLSNPRAVRREDEVINNQCLRDNAAGFALTRNPGVTMLWTTRMYEIFRTETGPLIQMGEPEKVDWYACGKIATREQVLESIASGLPNLEAMARTEQGGLVALQEARQRFDRWIPRASHD